MDTKSFANGFLCGLMGKGVLRGAEPVAYLYNGVRLPKLPEWDREKYPYAMIREYKYGNIITGYDTRYTLYVLSVRPYYNATYDHLSVTGDGVLRSATCTDGVWGSVSDDVSVNTSWGGYIPFWSNFDLLNEDGSVYLAASDPVPVYE